jgi:hypothetical protein
MMLRLAWVGLGVLGLGVGGLGQAPKHSKADDAIHQELSEPFCYFNYPTDQLGFMGCPKACIVTYDGAFLTPYGQLSFYTSVGGKLLPIRKRVKTLLDGYLPQIQFHLDREGLHYEFSAFSSPVNLDPKKNLITFIDCKVSNPGHSDRLGELAANYGDIASKINVDADDPTFSTQRESLKGALEAQRSTVWHTKQFMDPAEFEAKKGEISFGGGSMVQGNHLVFSAPKENAIPLVPIRDGFKEASVGYRFLLKAGASRSFEFRLPAVPVENSRGVEVSDVLGTDKSQLETLTMTVWRGFVNAAERFEVQDPKVMNTFRTSLVNDLIAREFNPPDQTYQRVNKIQYNSMWIRDSSFFTRTYDMLGLHDIARETLKPFLVWEDGKPVSFFKPGSPQPAGARLSVQEDYWGQVLWAFGAHIRTTQDKVLLRQVYPLLGPHIQMFVDMCKKDPKGLWPVAGPYDNEAINGHYTGHSFWALLGLKYAIEMAHDLHHDDDADAWQKIRDDYEANFLLQLRKLTGKSQGYIPPGMDNVNDGNDWDNASGGLYPFEVLPSNDSMAQRTLDMVRGYNYREGIITYGGNAWVAKNLSKIGKKSADGTLHHYEIFYVTEGNTARGAQRQVVEDLYSILAHTGSTNSGFEFGIPAWGSRDPGDNFTPHGWFASRYMSQIRNMLVREEGDDLHLASVLAPDWVTPGKEVKVTGAPTFFGRVSYVLRCQADGATMTLANRLRNGAQIRRLIVHVPWFVKMSKATVDGKPAFVHGNAIELPLDAIKLDMKWQWTSHPKLSYREAVRLFLEKYYHPERRGNPDFLF